ncbi:hypothetical protein [Burkholderia ambifaria]|uniref:hypothetical protein n=1 Tax=Burkholderia ambifaria TaxID=152480 RepID=UPI001C935834|nr:hypothetical protein [Burkholderia ambifaria]MBY4769282.1 hypothetical protein [Burkholderia ambifaria]
MKTTIAVILVAGASILAHAQWSGQAQTVDSYNWGTPVPLQPQKHRRPCSACSTSTVNPLNGRALHFVPSGAIDAATGRMLLSAGDGAVVSTLITAGAIFQRPCVRAANLVVSSTAFCGQLPA